MCLLQIYCQISLIPCFVCMYITISALVCALLHIHKHKLCYDRFIPFLATWSLLVYAIKVLFNFQNGLICSGRDIQVPISALR